MKILVVDDNIDNIDMMILMLKSKNYDVKSASNGQEALEKLRSEKYDLIISDILMPVMDGFQLCRECKKDPELCKICLVFYTATYIDDKDEEFALSLGAQKFIRKPQEPEVFLKIIKEAIEISGTRKNDPILVEQDEREILKLYSERLVTKLEKKNLDLEHEIAARIKTETKLKESEERFRIIFERSNIGKSLTATNGRMVQVNNAFAELLGYSIEEMQQLNFAEITHPLDIEESMECLRCLLANERDSYRMEKRYFHKNGKIIWADVSTAILRDRSGIPSYFITNIRDITEKKEQELELRAAKEKAEESDKLKTAFLTNISHEVRTPMNGIMGFIGLLKNPDLKTFEQEQYLEIIKQCSNQLLAIITNIVEISKLESLQISLNNTPANIPLILNTLFTTFSRNLSANQNVSLRVYIHSSIEACICITDEVKLIQILTNLIENAIKFTPEGTIEFGCQLDHSDELEFFVKDTGFGIAKEHHELIFDRFRQAETTPLLQLGGMGLGLSISKGYAELLGGKIWLDSELGKGSAFYFTIPYIPLTKEDQLTEVPLKLQNNVLSGKIILIAEDDDNNFMYLEEILLKKKVKILRANNGKEAVEFCKTYPEIELVLMDIKMPELNGYEATKQIVKFRKDLPIVAQTAYALSDDKQKAIDSGCVDYISKPITKDQLMAILYKHLK